MESEPVERVETLVLRVDEAAERPAWVMKA